jgi:hypothetical protein
VLDEHQPDWTLVYGDTNSTIAATLATMRPDGCPTRARRSAYKRKPGQPRE